MDGLSLNKPIRMPKPNIIPVPAYCRKLQDVEPEPPKDQRLEVTDPGKLLLLVESLFDNNTLELEKKLNYYIQKESNAQLVFIVTNVSMSDELVIQVLGQEVLDMEFRIPTHTSVFMDVPGCTTYMVNTLAEFEDSVQKILAPALAHSTECPHEIVVVPVYSRLKKGKNKVMPCMVCIVDSIKPKDFILKLVHEVYRFCLPVLMNTSKLEEEARIKRQCQSLLHVARKLFNHLNDVNTLLIEIMSEAKRITNAERCSLFLLDPDHVHLVAKVFDGVVYDNRATEVRIDKDQGIAGHVAATGKLLNIRDAYNHPLFFKGMDEATGFRTRNILCFPIRDEHGIVGVAQLCNKIQGDFDFFDEEVALAFSIYCGLSIVHSLVYKKMQDAQARSQLSNELMLYHMKVTLNDVNAVLLCTNRHSYLNYDNFMFPPKKVKEAETPCMVLLIFEDLGLFEKFHIRRDSLTRFILYVRRGYRDTPYHNWMHAWAVTHFAYVAIKELKLMENGFLTPLEVLAYITSCMCHDIDHRGTTNAFQLKTGSLLANLYSSEGAVMEHHHLSQTLCILNTESCNFLEGLHSDDYVRCLDLIKNMILATDLANHFVLKEKQDALISEGFKESNEEHRYILTCLLMTCADLSDQIKDWETVKVVAQQIYDEFFHEGDMEKSMGQKPAQNKDREVAYIPKLQIDFLNEVCLPTYEQLSRIFPEAQYLTGKIKRNILCWEASKPVFNNLARKGYTSLAILNSEELDEEVKRVLSMDDDKDKTQDDISDEG